MLSPEYMISSSRLQFQSTIIIALDCGLSNGKMHIVECRCSTVTAFAPDKKQVVAARALRVHTQCLQNSYYRRWAQLLYTCFRMQTQQLWNAYWRAQSRMSSICTGTQTSSDCMNLSVTNYFWHVGARMWVCQWEEHTEEWNHRIYQWVYLNTSQWWWERSSRVLTSQLVQASSRMQAQCGCSCALYCSLKSCGMPA